MLLVFLIGPWSNNALGQFDVGGSAGGFIYSLNYREDTEYIPRDIDYSSSQSLPYTVTLFYRERVSSRVSFTTEVQYRRLEFTSTGPTPQRLGASRPRPVMHYDMDLLTWSILPEYRLDAARRSVLRFGFQLGIWGKASVVTEIGDDGGEGHVSGVSQIGLVIGYGYRWALSHRWAVHLEAYGSRFFGHEPRLLEAGLKVGMARQFPGKSFWSLVRAGAPTR